MQKPLNGIKIIEIGSTIAAASASKQFTDFGAEVIKIELLNGGEIRRTPPFFQDIPKLIDILLFNLLIHPLRYSLK